MSADSPCAAEALYPAWEMRQSIDDGLTRALAEAYHRVAAGPVTSRLDKAALMRDLTAFDFEKAMPLEDALQWAIAQMEHGIVHIPHPRYFGLFNPAPTFPAQCADRIVNAFNPQLASAVTSPAAVAIEAHVITALAQKAGLPEGATGHFTSGGSEANLTAVLCALTHINPDFTRDGARAFKGQPLLYISRESHLAWVKIAHQTGIGRAAIRLMATDGQGRMDADILAQTIKDDIAAGHVPFMIAATAGTTNAGMVDPLHALADIARKNKLWYHVDAAWGGAALASPKLKGVLSGIERACSITVDAHKWFATTMGCGMFLTRHANAPGDTFHVAVNFMPSNTMSVDPYITTAQWSRRFMGLRLFLALAVAGWDGYAQHVERSVQLAALAQEKLRAAGWTIVNASKLAVICARPPVGSVPVRDLVARVVAEGRAWLSAASFEGEDVVRICVTHGETAEADVEAMVTALFTQQQG